MDLERKLEYFTQAIDKEVESRKRDAYAKMAAQAEESLAIAKTAAQAEANEGYETQMGAITKIMHKRVTEAQTTHRRVFANLQERLIAQLFDYIRADIISFTKSDKYEAHLISSIKWAQASSRHSYKYVQLAKTDTHLSEAIEKATGLTAEEGDKDAIGGFKLMSQNRGVSVDHTLQARLSRARQEFAQEVNSEINSEVNSEINTHPKEEEA